MTTDPRGVSADAPWPCSTVGARWPRWPGSLDVGTATLKRWRRQRRETGARPAHQPRAAGPDRPVPARGAAGAGRRPPRRHPGRALRGLGGESTGDRVSPAAMCRTLQRLGLTLTKSAWRPPSATRRRGRPGGGGGVAGPGRPRLRRRDEHPHRPDPAAGTSAAWATGGGRGSRATHGPTSPGWRP